MIKDKLVQEVTITPQMFINPPYVECPYCKKKEFGVIHVSSESYTRRCRSCLKSSSFSLPALKKRIVYLDQMAISEMMKLLNPTVDVKKKGRIKRVWKKLFEKLDRLVKLQLIICPDSTLHYYESLVVPKYNQALKRMYEQLSNGISFHDAEIIKRFQMSFNFRNWIGEKNLNTIDIYTVTSGDEIDGWQDRLRVSVEMGGLDKQIIDDIGRQRNQIGEQMKGVFERWQSEKGKNFMDWYEEERFVFGPMIFRDYLENIFSDNPFLLMSQTNALVIEIKKVFLEQGLSDEEALKKTALYFKSEEIKKVLYIKISAALFASIARKAASGQKKPPTMGDVNDIKAIASLAPYCDAMFVDNKMYSLLDEKVEGKHVREFVGLKTDFFCQNSMNKFLDYLQKIESSASKKHLEKVKEVYGESWGKPFLEMYDY